MICVNDPDGDVDFEALVARVRKAFETILTEKCAYEK